MDITDNSDLTIEPVDNVESITDFKGERVIKKNEYRAKRKAQLDNLRVPKRAPTASSTNFLLFRLLLISWLRSHPLLSSCLGSPTCLLPLLAQFQTFTALSSRFVPAPVFESLAVLLPFPMLGPTPQHLASTAFKTFKQALSNEPLCC